MRRETSNLAMAGCETQTSDLYVVDTNVISADAPTKASPAPDLAAWMDRNSAGLFLSVITIAEIEDGIAKSRREGATRKAERLSEWLETLLHLYAAQILPIDIAVARKIGVLADLARGHGHAPGLADLAIGATAQQHGMTVLTRNTRHFDPLGVRTHDPFAALPPELA